LELREYNDMDCRGTEPRQKWQNLHFISFSFPRW